MAAILPYGSPKPNTQIPTGMIECNHDQRKNTVDPGLKFDPAATMRVLLCVLRHLLLYCYCIAMLVKHSLEFKSIGKTLQKARTDAGYNVEQVSEQTKILPKFIRALENNDYTQFAAETYARGALRNYAQFLNLDVDQLLALHKREYTITPGVNTKRSQGLQIKDLLPAKLTRNHWYLAIAIILVGLVALYLMSQISYVLYPPRLELTSPISAVSAEGGKQYEYVTTEDRIRIGGITNSNTIVQVNGTIAATNPAFEFESEQIPLPNDENAIRVLATNQFGRESSILLTVKRIQPVEPVETMNATITVLSPTTATVYKDQELILQRQLTTGELINLVADQELIITLTDGQAIELNLNGYPQTVRTGKNAWTIVDGKIKYQHIDPEELGS